MMVQESVMCSIREIAIAWIAGRQIDFGSVTMSFVDMTDSAILFQVNEKIVQVMIPPSFQMNGCSSSPLASSGEVFLVTSVDCSSDEHFEDMLVALNEKLERTSIQPDSLSDVLDHLLVALKRYDKLQSCTKGKAGSSRNCSLPDYACNSKHDDLIMEGDEYSMADDSSEDHSGDDYGYDLAAFDITGSTSQRKQLSGFLYDMAENARLQCESARFMITENELMAGACEQNTFLAWCHVTPDQKVSAVKLVIHVGGIVRDENLASALGISSEYPLKIDLFFDENVWLQQCKKRLKYPPQVGCEVTQEVPLSSNDHGGLSEKCSLTMSYGKGVLLPKLVGAFFQYLYTDSLMSEEKPRSRQFYDELHQFTSMENLFVGLLSFICARLKTLHEWCIVCLNLLPYSVHRLQTCDNDLCLFTFEEVGVGTPVLQEVQSSPEIVDFQLSLALVAADSDKDVFEPFPSFLLVEKELRGRSGWFSKAPRIESSCSTKVAADENRRNFLTNKNVALLRALLTSIPSVKVMQKCRDEDTLRHTLDGVWNDSLESDRKSKMPEDEERPHKPKIKSLPYPYSVLRYILSTSRVQLHLLQPDESFRFFDSHYQFVVLHDSPEREAYFESRRLQQGGSFFAFHGSSADNWYSILRNGLRCLSYTSFMRAGASFGPGIYFGSSVDASINFCTTKGPGWGQGPLKNGFSVLAICEIIKGSLKVESTDVSHGMKGRGIMVVLPEYEKDVAIRYIIVLGRQPSTRRIYIDGTKMSENIDLMKHYLTLRSSYGVKQQEQRQIRLAKCFQFMSTLSEQRTEQEELNDGCAEGSTKEINQANLKAPSSASICKKPVLNTGVSAISMQAIAREYKNIMKQINDAKASKVSPKDEDFPLLAGLDVILPDEANVCRWHVHISQFLFKQFPLYKDLVECGRQWNVPEVSIRLECTFPEDYPFSPPFVRVISPKFGFHTGHVTVGGSICMELLTPSGWSPANTFESIVVQIVNAMIEGGGRLDKRAMATRSEYSEREAREAFNRVARDHGWSV